MGENPSPESAIQNLSNPDGNSQASDWQNSRDNVHLSDVRPSTQYSMTMNTVHDAGPWPGPPAYFRTTNVYGPPPKPKPRPPQLPLAMRPGKYGPPPKPKPKPKPAAPHIMFFHPKAY